MSIGRLIIVLVLVSAAFQAGSATRPAAFGAGPVPHASATDAWPWLPAGGLVTPYAAPTKVVSLPARTFNARPSYDWPLKPFDRPHPVRAYLDDPRIASATQRNFHIGIDIGTPGGSPVYAIETGIAHRSTRATVVAITSGAHLFGYWHIVPTVRNGQLVRRHMLVGRTLPTYNHVHLSERWHGRFVNPLRPGGIGPFADRTAPKTIRVSFRASGARRDPESLRGTVDLVADSFDVVPDVGPHPWAVTPALLRWRVLKGGRTVVAWHTAHDFRSAVLSTALFGSVYAQGTRANHAGRPGYFSFYLAHGFRTSSLANGRYLLEVTAADVRGNLGLSYFPITVAN